MRLLRFILSYLVIPNMPFVLAMQYFYMVRAIINVDYLLLGGIAFLLPKALVVVFFVLLMVIDFVSSLTPAYYMGLETMLASAKHALDLNIWTTLPITLIILAIATAVSMLALLIAKPVRKNGRFSVLASVLLVIAVYGIDLGGNTNLIRISDVHFSPVNITYSGTFKTLRALKVNIDHARKEQPRAKMLKTKSSVSELLESFTVSGSTSIKQDENIVIIIFESLGQLKDVGVNRLLMSPLLTPEIKKRYDIEIGTVHTEGATVSAEFRDLCGVTLTYEIIPLDDMPKCLPHYLKEVGYETVAMHGFSRTIFNRYEWWPLLGFDKLIFAEDVEDSPNVKKCGAIHRGINDAYMAELIHEELLSTNSDSRKFIYWVTLSTHIPLDEGCAEGSTFDCSVVPRHEGLCLWMRIINLVYSKIAEIASDPDLPPTRLIIVGDHSPSFLRRNLREKFIMGEVPLIKLIPRHATE